MPLLHAPKLRHDAEVYRDAIIRWIETLKPDLFVTINFCEAMPLHRVEYLLFAANIRILRHLFKRNWSKKKLQHPVWIACHERTETDHAHVHMFVRYPNINDSTWATYHKLWATIGSEIVGHNIAVNVQNIEPGTSLSTARYATKRFPDITCSLGCPPIPAELPPRMNAPHPAV
jgi:hypothetical protein